MLVCTGCEIKYSVKTSQMELFAPLQTLPSWWRISFWKSKSNPAAFRQWKSSITQIMDITKQSSKLESPEAKPTNVQEERFFFRNRIILQSSIERITIPIGRYRPHPPRGAQPWKSSNKDIQMKIPLVQIPIHYCGKPRCAMRCGSAYQGVALGRKSWDLTSYSLSQSNWWPTTLFPPVFVVDEVIVGQLMAKG